MSESLRISLAFLALAVLFVAAPHVISSGVALTMMSLMGVMIIFALSYNMLLGQTGLLSFGHAVYYGLAGFCAAHAMNLIASNKLPIPLPVIPLVGAALAGLAGVIAGPALVTQPSMAALLGPILFVVIVVGGLGSLGGAFVASLLIGLVQTFAVAINVSLADVIGPFAASAFGELGRAPLAQIAPVLPYLMLVLVLVFKPTGLFGNRET